MKVFKMTIINQDGVMWNDAFATNEQTELGALHSAQRMWPTCTVVPARFINKMGWFWFGAAAGFAIAFFLIAAIVAFYIPFQSFELLLQK